MALLSRSERVLSQDKVYSLNKSEFFRSPSGALVVKNLSASVGDRREVGPVPGLGRYPGGEQGIVFQYFCLENPMDREAWWATIGLPRLEHD